MSLLEDVSLALQAGRAPKVKELVQQAVDEGLSQQHLQGGDGAEPVFLYQ